MGAHCFIHLLPGVWDFHRLQATLNTTVTLCNRCFCKSTKLSHSQQNKTTFILLEHAHKKRLSSQNYRQILGFWVLIYVNSWLSRSLCDVFCQTNALTFLQILTEKFRRSEHWNVILLMPFTQLPYFIQVGISLKTADSTTWASFIDLFLFFYYNRPAVWWAFTIPWVSAVAPCQNWLKT